MVLYEGRRRWCLQRYGCDLFGLFFFNLKMDNVPRMSEKENSFLLSGGRFENTVSHPGLSVRNVKRTRASRGAHARASRYSL